MDYAKESLRMHSAWKGKIEVISSEEHNETEFLIYFPIYEVEKITKKIGV